MSRPQVQQGQSKITSQNLINTMQFCRHLQSLYIIFSLSNLISLFSPIAKTFGKLELCEFYFKFFGMFIFIEMFPHQVKEIQGEMTSKKKTS